MRYSTVAVEKRGTIAEVRLDRPDRGNPIDARLLDELDAACAELHDDPAVRVVLLTATGDVFSHGWDVAEAPRTPRDPSPFRCLELLGQPVIACLQGDAVGAGLELALACDVRIAAEGAMFALPDIEMGMMPRGGGTQRVPRLVGPGKAAEIILLGTKLDAAEALTCGLVSEVHPRAELAAAADRLASAIASRGPLAVRYAKEAILRGLEMPLEQALRYETDLTVILQTTADRAEGVAAFVEKREAKFEGR
jgi:enoyl-CoA hydratase